MRLKRLRATLLSIVLTAGTIFGNSGPVMAEEFTQETVAAQETDESPVKAAQEISEVKAADAAQESPAAEAVNDIEDTTEDTTEDKAEDKGEGTDADAAVEDTAVKAVSAASAVLTPEVSVSEIDVKGGTAVVKISGLDDEQIKSVLLPTWCTNDQRDLKWYAPEKQENGDYLQKISIADHDYRRAVYYADMYYTDADNTSKYGGGVTLDFSISVPKPSVTVDYDKEICTVECQLDGDYAGIKKLMVPTWTFECGQDDLMWVDMSYDSEKGAYIAQISTKKYKHTGQAIAEVYAVDQKGAKKYLSGSAFEIVGPTAQSVSAAADQSNGSFKITASNVQNLDSSYIVKAAVWSDAKQGDLVWYSMGAYGSDYASTGNISRHKYNLGSYKIHVYAVSPEKGSTFIGGAAMEFKPEFTAFDVSDNFAGQAGKEQKNYTGTLTGLKIPGGAKEVKAAVWSANKGQDDLVWYPMTMQSDGSYTFSLDITSHKTAGQYLIDVYAVTKGGTGRYITGKYDLAIDAPKGAAVSAEAPDPNKGTFNIVVSGIDSKSGMSKVDVAVWTKTNGQDDLKWYTAVRRADGSFAATVNAANHKARSDEYIAHVYGTAGNGIRACVGKTTCNFALNNNAVLINDGEEAVSRTITIVNPAKLPVKFAVWSSEGGQDDIHWVNAVNKGNGVYSASVNCADYKHDGTFIIHAYSGSTYLSLNNFSWKAKTAQKKLNSNMGMYVLAQGFSSPTNYLILVNRSIHRVAIYEGSQGNWREIKYWPCVNGKPSTPTPAGTFNIKGRFSWFGDGHKSWWATQITGYYYFHSQIYYWDDAPIRVLDPAMGVAASAGCIRLYEPNARWIYTQIPRGTTVHIY